MENNLILATETFLHMSKIAFPISLCWALGGKALKFMKNALLGIDLNI